MGSVVRQSVGAMTREVLPRPGPGARGTILVRVVDEQGDPIEGATIEVEVDDESQRRRGILLPKVLTPEEEPPFGLVTTGEDGIGELTGLPPARAAHLKVSADGCVTSYASCDAPVGHELRSVLDRAPWGGHSPGSAGPQAPYPWSNPPPRAWPHPPMNWDQIAGNWEQFKGRIQQEWGRLTDDDLEVAAGGRKRLEGLLRQAYGYSEERAEQQLDEFLRRLEESEDSDSGGI